MTLAPTAPRTAPASSREPLVLAALYVAFLVLTGFAPKERVTWWLEVAPAIIALALLAATWSRFRFTPLVYRLVFLHGVILAVGGHYTYAEVPLGFWMQSAFGFARNHYDRIGHLAQGFVPALVVRELLVRRGPMRGSRWLMPIVTGVCLGISAAYELFEWATALWLGQGADAFLGTQGDPWDTQEDMFCCLIGALAAQLTLGRWHDRQIERAEALPR